MPRRATNAATARRNATADERHLTVADLAEREGVDVLTVYGWNRTGRGPTYLRLGRYVRYRLSDVIAWEDSRAVKRAESWS
jgi:predicted DNA-binding transcriptional regulator AlpA